jgi:GT2 family glycosyltransferase
VTALVSALADPKTRQTIDVLSLRRESGINLESMFLSQDGWCFLCGWIESAELIPITSIDLCASGQVLGTTMAVARCRKIEPDERFRGSDSNLAGFWTVLRVQNPAHITSKLELIVVTADQKRRCIVESAVAVIPERLRDLALEYIANAQYYGDHTVGTFLELDKGIGQALIDLNHGIVERIIESSYCMRFGGAQKGAYDGSIIVCLFGKLEYLTLQAALFSECPGFERYEFIYVCNSPELGEALVADAAIAARIYRVDITLIILPGNAGFGAANNVAATAARTDRLLFVNPDVFPRAKDWPRRHAEMVRGLPSDHVRFFGTTLYYDDGSLMHGGMYIEIDGGLSIRNYKIIRRDALRVEHYGKGAPTEAENYRRSRPVPAVTGAFMSIDRDWFEKLGAFSRKYIYAHYEDVDLCLRSLQSGVPVWVHDLPFWHLESQGSTQEPAHLGGMLINRWLATLTWGDLVKAKRLGSNPAGLRG